VIRNVPPVAAYSLFAAGLAAATFPVWRLWLFGFDPTLDDLLRLRCFGL
jgi:hypothetical protein